MTSGHRKLTRAAAEAVEQAKRNQRELIPPIAQTRVPSLDMTVTVGPFSVVFGNRNDAMGLKLHFHTAYVWLEYAVDDGGHGYPSFEATNNALREHLRWLCADPFENATNEDVVAILFNEMREFTHPSWSRYGGSYHLAGIRLDVVGVPDSIGHDDGATVYTLRERKC